MSESDALTFQDLKTTTYSTTVPSKLEFALVASYGGYFCKD